MQKIRGAEEVLLGTGASTADANRFYSILLDARGSATSETMYDVAEKLLHSEKENAKLSLEQLWSLKKSMANDASSGTVELMISYYQDKINILRDKEEKIQQISKDSRKLLEEKRTKDSELATVKQEIGDCTTQLTDLKIKLDKLSVREQELTLIEMQLQKELQINENEIANGLYEIILSQQERGAEGGRDDVPLDSKLKYETETLPLKKIEPAVKPEAAPEPDPVEIKPATDADIFARVDEKPAEHADGDTDEVAYKQVEQRNEPAAFPKSVVKTTKGRVIGEYYYDVKVYKNKRHYIFNSGFFSEQLGLGMNVLRTRFDQVIYTDLLQMAQDALKRVGESPNLHYEISTNELLNERTIKELVQNLKTRTYNDIDRFSARLAAKVEGLGSNYNVILKEQMERLVTG